MSEYVGVKVLDVAFAGPVAPAEVCGRFLKSGSPPKALLNLVMASFFFISQINLTSVVQSLIAYSLMLSGMGTLR